MKITNKYNLPLLLQVWALIDNYDYNDDPWTISASTLLKSTKQIILGSRLKDTDRVIDFADFIPSRMGTAVHDSIERAWEKREQVLNLLNIKEKDLDIDIERRSNKKLGKWTITGKYDGVNNGRVFDHKTTSVYAWIFKSNDVEYTRQLSIYRWLNPDIITDDIGTINFIFTDWQKSRAKIDKNYPKLRLMSKDYKLLSLADTEEFIRVRTDALEKYWNLPEIEIPDCTDEELWRTKTIYKYYSNPAKRERSTRNFDNYSDAELFRISKGSVGVVVPVKGEAKRCIYCPAFPICEQRRRYFDDDGVNIE